MSKLSRPARGFWAVNFPNASKDPNCVETNQRLRRGAVFFELPRQPANADRYHGEKHHPHPGRDIAKDFARGGIRDGCEGEKHYPRLLETDKRSARAARGRIKSCRV
jgi:hypothetical protein